MIGIYHLHKQQMDEACTMWCTEAEKLFDEVKAGNERYKYKDVKTGKTHLYNKLYDKIDGVSRIILKNFGLSDINHEIAEGFRTDELQRVFTNIRTYLKSDWNQIQQVASQYRKNCERTMLYYYVNKALKEPFGELYKMMRDRMQDMVFEKLNIRTCPYCNRQYTFTLVPKTKGEPYTSPEFDHFFSKSQYPTLAISFYNLVPSCHCCNHGKGAKQLHLNPYDRSFDGHFYVCDNNKNVLDKNQLLNIKDKAEVYITYQGDWREEEDIRTLGLDQLYAMHSDYVEEVIDRARAYNNLVNHELVDAFQGPFTSSQAVYEFVWGRYLEIPEQERKPLAKFTKDILDQVGIKR